jgi:hypothetical protein
MFEKNIAIITITVNANNVPKEKAILPFLVLVSSAIKGILVRVSSKLAILFTKTPVAI